MSKEKYKKMKEEREARIKTAVKENNGRHTATGKRFEFIHNGERILSPIQERGGFEVTKTKNTIFIGTNGQCQAEIKRLGLVS